MAKKRTYYYASADGKTATKFRAKRTPRSYNRNVAYEAANKGRVIQISKEAYKKYYKGGKLVEGYKTGAMSEGTRKALGIQDYYTASGRSATSPFLRGGGRGQGYSYPETFNRLNIFRDPNYVAPKPKPTPAPAPAPPAISAAAKQYRADTLKILQQADAMRNQFAIDQKNAAAQRAKDEAARVEREKIAAASAAARSANEMRAGQAPNIQLQPASQAPTTGGTQPFKRRSKQFGGASPYTSLAISSQL